MFRTILLASIYVASISAFGQAQTSPSRIGILCPSTCTGTVPEAFADELRVLGWVEGQNLVADRREAHGRQADYPRLLAELVALRPNVIVATTNVGVKAAAESTSTIPVVFGFVGDPVALGIVKSMAHPGGNVTGVTAVIPGGFMTKDLQLLRELLPSAKRIAVLLNPNNAFGRHLYDTEAPTAAALLALQLEVHEVRRGEDIADAVAKARAAGADGMYVPGDSIFHNPPERLPAIAAKVGIPTLFTPHDMVQVGGLMAHGVDSADISRRHARYVDRVLKGTRPSDLPIDQPMVFKLSINLKTARTLGLDVPASILARADNIVD